MESSVPDGCAAVTVTVALAEPKAKPQTGVKQRPDTDVEAGGGIEAASGDAAPAQAAAPPIAGGVSYFQLLLRRVGLSPCTAKAIMACSLGDCHGSRGTGCAATAAAGTVAAAAA
jgi:hypothetical protein